MKVLWISDYGIKHTVGGAQRSNQILIVEGRFLGHHITEFNIDSDLNLLNNNYDVVVSSNLEAIYSRYSYICQLISDYRLPKNGKLLHVRVEHDSNRYLKDLDRKILFSNCDMACFLSQFHFDKFNQSYGDIFKNVEIIPDPIDSKIFYDMRIERSNDILYVGYMHLLKGTGNFVNYVMSNPDKKFVVAGWGEPFASQLSVFENVDMLGTIEHSQMPVLFNSYNFMYYKPLFYEPFCRSVAEAMLCGTKIIGNQEIGCIHEYNRLGYDTFKTRCLNAATIFWNKIQCLKTE